MGLLHLVDHRYRVRLRREAGLRGLLITLFVVAHGLRLRWAIRRKLAGKVVVHAHFLARPAEVGRIATLRGGPLLVTVHAGDAELERNAEHVEFVRSVEFFRRASAYVQRVLARTFPELFTVTIPCVVRLPPARAPRPGLYDEDREGVILTVARLVETKGYAEMIEAIRCLGTLGNFRWRWEIIGDRPLRARLEELAQAGLGTVRVVVRGSLSHEQALEAILEADVFLLLSRPTSSGTGEGLPVALMEAMAAGVPTISTMVAGIPELVIHQRTGYLVDPTSPNQVAQLIHEIAVAGSPIGDAGIRHVAENFAPDQTVPRLKDVVLDLPHKEKGA